MIDDLKIKKIANSIGIEAEAMTEYKICELKKVISDFYNDNTTCSDNYILNQVNELLDGQYTNFYEHYYSKILDELAK